MAERKTRGKRSKIDLLPTAIKAELDLLLRDNKMTQKDILNIVNALIDEAGLSDDIKLSPAGVNRYASKMETIGADIKAAREMSEMWVAKLGTKPTGDVTMLLMEMLRSQYFKLMVKANDNPDEVLDPKTIGNLALSIQRLERAALLSIEKEKQIKKAFAEEVESNVTDTAKKAGLSSQNISLLRQAIGRARL